MFPEKNSVHDVKIDDVNMLGYGVCRIGGKVCFVKNGITGDSGEITVIKSAASYCVGKWNRLTEQSALRREAPCGAYPACGGCAFASLDYAEEARIKTEFVRAEFKKASLDPSIIVPLPSKTGSGFYRNKALIPVSRGRDGRIALGFYAENSHRVVPFGVCSLMPPVFSEIAHGFERFLAENRVSVYDELSQSGAVRHLYLRTNGFGELMICAVLSAEKGFLKKEFVDFALSYGAKSVFLNIQPRPDNVILGEKCILLAGDAVLTDELCSLRFEISPLSFYQVNRACAEKLYAAAKRLLDLRPDDVLADFYCGTGTIGLTMADSVKEVIGIEVIPDAVENARKNAAANGIKNARFICADAKEALEAASFSPTTAVVDPPRKGTTEQFVDLIARTKIDRLAYVSCNPATLARDLARFAERGFVARTALLFDMFPRTGHVETVVRLSRRDMNS